MEKYKNKSGESGVTHYEIGTDYINIRFQHSPEIYMHHYKIPCKSAVEKMKVLAEDGKSLSTFIGQEVKDNYFSKG
ncbi:MAG: hypothetical protein ACXWEY_12175 [Bacteroidia bacterium]